MTEPFLREFLEASYMRFNRSEFIDPDPLILPREYQDVKDREIAGLIASCLALGRAPLIVKAAREILARMDNAPRSFVEAGSSDDYRRAFAGFRYRFFTGNDIASLLGGVKGILATAKSPGKQPTLGAFFSSCVRPEDETVLPALSLFVERIVAGACGDRAGRAGGDRARFPSPETPPFAKNLLPSPRGGSACKRPLLFLRWMIRSDAVDPGGWDSSLAPLLVQPMDTHMTWVAERFGFASCGSAPSLKTAVEVTRHFRQFSIADPVKYDFALTRPGIRSDLSRDDWFSVCR